MASLEDLIPTVNKLQDVMYESGIDTLDLPVLAVIGSQSSGKSSILETLVGKDFLPRGTGIVTRRPLVLQLNNIPVDSPLINSNNAKSSSNSNNDDDRKTHRTEDSDTESIDDEDEDYEMTLEDHLKINNGGSKTNGIKNKNNNSKGKKDEWGEFLHKPGKRYYDFKAIKREIENETERIAGKNKGISKIPINLKIYSPHVLNLTLVDLPGITKVPIGEQPPDIEKQIRNLILDYIATPNCIILAVSPANIDLVNSESLKLAREVDPIGKRTIGVITKLDLMDSGTHALDILSGKLYPLKLGFVGVVNRSQQDIQLNKSVEESLANEEEYFSKHSVYRTISNRCGTRYLAKTLNQILVAHIREKLPDIKARLSTLVGQTEEELASYGDIGMIANENRAGLILQLMNKFASKFISSIDGTYSDIGTKELCGGARIYYVFNNIFGNSLKSISPTANLTTHDIRTAIRNSTGPRPSLFVPELAFDLLVKPQIKLLLDPSQRCVELVYEELVKICHNSSTNELARYPKLQSMLVEVVSELLKERLIPTRSYVESLIDIHRAYINTNHPNFISAADAMSDILNKKSKMKNLTKTQPIQEQGEIKPEGSMEKAPSSTTTSTTENDVKSQIEYTEILDGQDMKQSKESFLNYFFGKDAKSQEPQNPLNFGSMETPLIRNNNDLNIQFDSFNLNDFNNTDYLETDNISSNLTEKEELECELIKRLIISYFTIVREMIQDQVPKAVMCLLVNYCKETVQNTLVTKLYKESMFDDLLVEDRILSQNRDNCLNLLKTYKEASNIINEIL
ncbi:hypothetical protein Kpol_2002p110 [Vanderwaltozyma polyspora DSM 70294]|uniref:Dynamin-related protein DNM1 n=1 Tax=Vanderwaltozyma polyspora (strain ATCC 22028 / DSM 70294 / BCRC 21397 / CBS 2163 / NBRC 10782 / NRRL Y-8283 / UCD 57-17) TaxID=436907 RepID=A7TFM3_VANPO|nr:uncharacterized protein Kpol_2002p110 [Vanderwaltozyma polyspora DSM 70294]EDO19037.1 hypothetical protein Kpol_2002p110 [Vanderwaltozyma polyspora DSM 70294]